MKEEKISKTIYLTPLQLEKVKNIQKNYEKKTKISISFSNAIAKLIEEKK